MPEYRVCWEIDVEADSPREAAEKARDYQRHGKACHVYDVYLQGTENGEVVDLDALEGRI